MPPVRYSDLPPEEKAKEDARVSAANEAWLAQSEEFYRQRIAQWKAGMRVRDLIAKLQSLPQDMPVAVVSDESLLEQCESVEVEVQYGVGPVVVIL